MLGLNIYISPIDPAINCRAWNSQLSCDLTASETLRLQSKCPSDHAPVLPVNKSSAPHWLTKRLVLFSTLSVSPDRGVSNSFGSSDPSNYLTPYAALLRKKIDKVKDYRVYHGFAFLLLGHKRLISMFNTSATACRIRLLLRFPCTTNVTEDRLTPNVLAMSFSIISWRISNDLM